MNRRHVRAVAVAGFVIVTLTGARHSHGGGCGHHDSNSSTSGGYRSSGSTTGSGTSGSSPTAAATTSPESDISVSDCKVDVAGGKLSARIRVTNGNSVSAATYNGTVEFTDQTGSAFGSAPISQLRVPAHETRSTQVSGTFITGGSNQPQSGRCKLGQAWKANM
ncbi:hypothetical protein [Streptomyces pinistramenti]|uniref:hypothetical protein n=1 Tax=Streptomyces pinistramenti TaxID=2884812 RepID=UPI001D099B91|nr:hypothetical protein [Streptomyces pinistramenti]MCB5906568.1 hypothetical protein [Streptomyces pinistramenti]